MVLPKTVLTEEEKDAAAKEEQAKKDEQARKEALNEEERKQKQAGIAKLVGKLTREDGSLVPIALLPPIDYTTQDFGAVVEQTILSTIARYGNFNVQEKNYVPTALTLEQFRKVVTRYNVDVVIICVVKPTNFDLFLYDRRTPYRIFSHSEVLPQAQQYNLTKELVEEYTKVIARRTLYAYMQDQFYELPRENTPSILSAEIPRWITSNRSLEMVNREILSNFYASLGFGGAYTVESGKGGWTSNIVSLALGVRLSSDFQFELGADMFSYNAVLFSLKYVTQSKDSPFKLIAGLGAAYTFNDHTLNWDQNYTQFQSPFYIVPSFGFNFPMGDVHVKLESHFYVGLTGGLIFTLMPGLLLNF